MLEVNNVTKVFNEGRPNEYTALRDVNLKLPLSATSVFMGPSGSGKTTLLSIIGCMARPTSGRVVFADREITGIPERFMSEVRRTTFGFIFQSFNLIRGLSVLDNVILPAHPVGTPAAKVRERASELLERFRLSPKSRQKVELLSGGEKQRVAMVRALINDPDVLIADEPTAHLDSELAREFMELVRHLGREGKTILIASHDPLVCEAEGVDNLVRLRDGEIVEGGCSLGL